MDQQFNNLDKQVALMNQELKALCDKVTEGFELNSEEHTTLVSVFEKALDKKAEKIIVDNLAANVDNLISNQNKVAWMIIGTVILAVLGLIIIK